jgi:hypothetical protein
MTPHPTRTNDRSPLSRDSQETPTSTSRAGITMPRVARLAGLAA